MQLLSQETRQTLCSGAVGQSVTAPDWGLIPREAACLRPLCVLSESIVPRPEINAYCPMCAGAGEGSGHSSQGLPQDSSIQGRNETKPQHSAPGEAGTSSKERRWAKEGGGL